MLLSSLRGRLHRQRTELQAALARIQDLATLDDLTGLANRRRAHELLSAEVTRGQRATQPFAVALVDLDRFKRLNDRFGHAGGDEALRHFAEAARANMRACDLVARWGGEEFLLLMPETGLDQALEALERLRAQVESASIASAQGEMRFTFSAGVAVYRVGQTVADTVARADRALYRAKAGGRNRVEREDDAADGITTAPPDRPPALRDAETTAG
jgi:diguanylate cyclase